MTQLLRSCALWPASLPVPPKSDIYRFVFVGWLYDPLFLTGVGQTGHSLSLGRRSWTVLRQTPRDAALSAQWELIVPRRLRRSSRDLSGSFAARLGATTKSSRSRGGSLPARPSDIQVAGVGWRAQRNNTPKSNGIRTDGDALDDAEGGRSV